ncbi:MAG: hypothetical protein NTZ10_02535 [Candidatus Saganbacteria bacterium]|nr:hypothetical protein [Candidatus Saganbacteria bacterium]
MPQISQAGRTMLKAWVMHQRTMKGLTPGARQYRVLIDADMESVFLHAPEAKLAEKY